MLEILYRIYEVADEETARRNREMDLGFGLYSSTSKAENIELLMDCEVEPNCCNDCESCEYAKILEKQEQEMQVIQAVYDNVAKAISDTIEPLATAIDNFFINALIPCLKEVFAKISTIGNAIMYLYPNKKVVHLALHHPKERVRKKNRKRIFKWIEKEIRKDSQQ